MELVSVIIPTYKRVDYLKLTLDSVVNQTYKAIEIIVVDDGSPNDDAAQLCEGYGNVNYIKVENSGGPCQPRNIGMDKAKGTYLAFVDDDDIWLPNKIKEQINILENNKDFGLVHCYCDIIDENGEKTGNSVGRPRDIKDKHGDVKLRMMGSWTLMMPTPVVRKSLINEVGCFNTEMPQTAADVEFWTRCSFHTKFYYQDLALVHYRKHSNNMSSDLKPYVNVPIHLKAILKSKFSEKKITKTEYNQLLLNLCFSQAKHIKQYPFQTIFNLFKLNPFWIVNFRTIKVIVKRLTT